MNKILKYKWLYLWIAAAALLVLGLIMVISRDIGQAIVLIATGIILIVSVIIRIVPLIKTLRGKWARAINILALLLDAAAGVIIIWIVAAADDLSRFSVFFPFLIGGALFVQGLVYLIETSFLGTKPEALKYLIHILLLSLGVVIMARFDTFDLEYFRWLIGIAFLLCFVFATIDGIFHYDKYRKGYVAGKSDKAAKVDWAKNATVSGAKADGVSSAIEDTAPETEEVNEESALSVAVGAEDLAVTEEPAEEETEEQAESIESGPAGEEAEEPSAPAEEDDPEE